MLFDWIEEIGSIEFTFAAILFKVNLSNVMTFTIRVRCSMFTEKNKKQSETILLQYVKVNEVQ